jgi:hypothetical protein
MRPEASTGTEGHGLSGDGAIVTDLIERFSRSRRESISSVEHRRLHGLVLHVSVVVFFLVRRRGRTFGTHLLSPLIGFVIIAFVPANADIHAKMGAVHGSRSAWCCSSVFAYPVGLPSLHWRLDLVRASRLSDATRLRSPCRIRYGPSIPRWRRRTTSGTRAE